MRSSLKSPPMRRSEPLTPTGPSSPPAPKGLSAPASPNVPSLPALEAQTLPALEVQVEDTSYCYALALYVTMRRLTGTSGLGLALIRSARTLRRGEEDAQRDDAGGGYSGDGGAIRCRSLRSQHRRYRAKGFAFRKPARRHHQRPCWQRLAQGPGVCLGRRRAARQ